MSPLKLKKAKSLKSEAKSLRGLLLSKSLRRLQPSERASEDSPSTSTEFETQSDQARAKFDNVSINIPESPGSPPYSFTSPLLHEQPDAGADGDEVGSRFGMIRLCIETFLLIYRIIHINDSLDKLCQKDFDTVRGFLWVKADAGVEQQP
jgi:hypothetical protein